MSNEQLKKEVLVFLDQPDTEFLYDKAANTDDVDVLQLYLKKAKRIWATNISEADQLIKQVQDAN
jgi:hypothetical protein